MAIGDPHGYQALGVHHVVYRGTDNQVHELFINSGGRWVFNTITLAAGAPQTAGNPYGYQATGVHHVVYRGMDNQIHELFINQTGNWAVNTVSIAPGAPNATGVATGNVTGPRKAHGQSLRRTRPRQWKKPRNRR